MSVFLIDFENVHSQGISGIEKLSADDRVYLFYSNNADSLSFRAHKAILNSEADIQYMSVTSGVKNALDFQLVSFLGYLIAVSPYSNYIIISSDNGFSAVKSFWRDIEISIKPSINSYIKPNELTLPEMPAEAAAAKAEINNDEIAQSVSEPAVSAEIKRMLDIFSTEKIKKEERNNIIALAKKSSDKQQFYTGMTKIFGMEKGLHLYKILRPEYANIKKLPKNFTKNN